MGTADPVTVGEPELAPFVGRLNVVVVGESLVEPPLRFTRATERGRGECEHAIGRRFFVAITELAAVLEAGLRFVVSLLVPAHQVVALGAATTELRDNIV